MALTLLQVDELTQALAEIDEADAAAHDEAVRKAGL